MGVERMTRKEAEPIMRAASETLCWACGRGGQLELKRRVERSHMAGPLDVPGARGWGLYHRRCKARRDDLVDAEVSP
jgi:hypothetical protein